MLFVTSALIVILALYLILDYPTNKPYLNDTNYLKFSIELGEELKVDAKEMSPKKRKAYSKVKA
jgi:hypothetical protein